MKKLTLMFLFSVMFFTGLSAGNATASTTDKWINDVCYRLDLTNQNCTVVGIRNIDIDTVEIRDNVLYQNLNYPVVAVKDRAFDNVSVIQSIIIGKNVVNIGEYAFSGMVNLQSVVIPNSVKNIGHGAFFDCATLEKVQIGSGLIVADANSKIEERGLLGLFERCTYLREINIDANHPRLCSIDGVVYTKDCKELVLYPGDWAETGTADRRTFFLPETVETVRSYAFSYLTHYESTLVMNENLKKIDSSAFYCCGNGRSISINMYVKNPNPITFKLGSYDSSICDQMKVFVPYGSLSQYQNAAGWASIVNLQEGVYNSGLWTVWDNGIYYDRYESGGKSYCRVIQAPEGKKYTGSINIPSKVEKTRHGQVLETYIVSEISDYAFNNSEITDITIDEGVTKIGNFAFANSPNLKSVKTPDSMTEFGDGAFYKCPALESVTIGKGLQTLGQGKSPLFGNTRMYSLFYQDYNLKSIVISPENPKFVSVDNVIFSKDKKKLLFFSPAIKGAYTVPETVVEIDAFAFSNSNLSEITLNKGLQKIGEGAFKVEKGIERNIATINSVNPVPPTIAWVTAEVGKRAHIFTNNYFLYSTLNVPTGSRSAYAKAEEWKRFTYIKEKDFSGGSSVSGDVNKDGVVDVADVTSIISIILGTSETSKAADLNNDGVVDVADVTSVIEIILN